jgi:hypothetical protein
MPRTVPRLVSLAVLLLVLTACDLFAGTSPSPAVRALGPGERWLPVARWDLPGGGHMLCAGGGTIGYFQLHGAATDPRLAWMIEPTGRRTELAFSPGWSARFTPRLEVLDADAWVVAREGSPITGTCNTAQPAVVHADF